ncbi:hypothetical protein ACHAPT_011108 [Fusarium lateritium]
MEIFGWTTAAQQPLTLTQLQEALSVKVGQRNLHPDDLVSGMDRITVWCENLVCVEETDNKVHFSHHSIREYLLQPDSGAYKDFHVDLEAFDQHVGEICVTYLNLENLKTSLIESEKPEPPPAVTVAMEGLTEQTVRTAVGGSMGARIGRWTSRVVKSSARSAQPSAGDSAIQSTLGQLRHAPPAPKGVEYVFLEYASGNWFRHRTRLNYTYDPAEDSMWNLVGRLLRSSRQPENLPWNDQSWRNSNIKQASLVSTTLNPTEYVMSQEPAYSHPAAHPASDLSPIGSLPFLAVYAVQNDLEGLACCALMTFIEERPTSPVAKWLTLVLALEGKHSYCPNGCFARLQRYFDHEELVETLTLGIAVGVSHWPAPPKDGSQRVRDDIQACKCSENRFRDFCKVVSTGYNAEEHLYLQDFALVALCGDTKASVTDLSGDWADDSLLNSRTSNNMSIIDIAAEQTDSESLEFIISFFGNIDIRKADLQPTMKKLALSGLCTALRSRATSNAAFLLNQCTTLFSFEEGSQYEPLDIAYLRMALSSAVRFDWPSDTITRILSWYFQLVVKRDMETNINDLIEKSVRADNWRFAAAVVDATSTLEFEWQKNNDPFLEITLDALKCPRCRGRQSWPEISDRRYLLAADQQYKLCSKHKRQALASLDPGLFLTPDQGSLRLANVSETMPVVIYSDDSEGPVSDEPDDLQL